MVSGAASATAPMAPSRMLQQDKLTIRRPSGCLTPVLGVPVSGLCPPSSFQNFLRSGHPLQRASASTGLLPKCKGSDILRKSCVRMVLGPGGQQQTSSQQGAPKAPAWHPLEEVTPFPPAPSEGTLSPAECARTVVETNEDGVLFTQMFPEGQSEGLDIAYVTNDRGEIYFEVDGIDWEGADLEFLEQEEVSVVVGYNQFDESGTIEEEDEEDALSPYPDFDSEDESDEDDFEEEDGQILSEYLAMLQNRGIPIEDMSVESFGTLGAYGGFSTLETVHPLDFAIRLSEAVESQNHPELETPQARVMLRGVVELVSPDEERRVRKEWLRRGLLAREDEVHEAAASLLEELALQDERETDEEKLQAARELADKALEQLRKDLERPQTRAPGSVRAAALFEKLAERESSAEGDLEASSSKPEAASQSLERVHKHASSVPEQSNEASEQEPRSNVEALLRKRLKVLKGFPRPGRSSEAKHKPEVEEKHPSGALTDGNRAVADVGDRAETELEEERSQEAVAVPRVLAPQSEAVEQSRRDVGSLPMAANDTEPTTSQLDGPDEQQEQEGSRIADAAKEEETIELSKELEEDVGSADIPLAEVSADGVGQKAEDLSETETCASSLEEMRQDRGSEASTSGSSDDTSLEPQILKSVDLGGLSRWLNSLESSESPIIWDQNRWRLWLGDDISVTSLDPGLDTGGLDLEGVLWGEDEGEEVAFWRGSDVDEDTSDEEGAAEGPPLYRLRVTSVCFTSPTGVERTIDASEYAAAQPDTLCEASATLMEQVNHAGHKVAHALVRLCKRMRGMDVEDASMVAVDRYGFDLRVTQGTEMKTVRVSFPEVAVDEHHAMVLLEDMMWLNKKPDKKLFRFRRSALRRQMLELDEPGSASGLK